jgi:hypothetical protein
MHGLIVLSLLAVLAGQTAELPPPFPRPGTTQLFENDVVAVWNVSWLKQQYPLHTHRYDLVGVSYADGDRIITGRGRRASPLAAFGQAVENAPRRRAPSRQPVRQDPHEPGHLGLRRRRRCRRRHLSPGQSFGRRLRNQNPLNVHRLFEQLRKGGVFGGRIGHVCGGADGVETALWDLAGKALGVPVYQLLGGKFRDRSASTWTRRFTSPAAHARAVRRSRSRSQAGWDSPRSSSTSTRRTTQQVRPYNWTASPGELQRMVDQMTAAREAVGPNMDICADMHGRYDLPTAQAVAKAMEPLNLMWLEEPRAG